MKINGMCSGFALTLCVLLAAGVATAGGMGSGDPSGPDAERVVAVAALEPVGAAAGWGHVRVRDLIDAESIERSATVRLFGLEPGVAYRVEVDDVLLAELTTDASGDGWVRLGSEGNALPAVPTDLAPAAELFDVVVLDPSLAPTLQGKFVIQTAGDPPMGELVYMERIRLDAVDSDTAVGMARVVISQNGEQRFTTAACGLAAEALYTVAVEGDPVAVVTTDAVGHGRLSLSTLDEENPLPPNLDPVDELRLVEWLRDGDSVVLTGTFTGTNQAGRRERPDGNGGSGDGHHGDGAGAGDGNGDGNGDGSGDGGGHGPGGGSGTGDCDGSGGGGRP